MKEYRCNNCGYEYQANAPHLHAIIGIVCLSCLIGNRNLIESEWS